jgi:hypothetical protein
MYDSLEDSVGGPVRVCASSSECQSQENMPLKKSSEYPKDACVGPYWLVCDDSRNIRLIAHRCALADAEEYGDCLTCPHGHYDLWEGWRTGPARTA